MTLQAKSGSKASILSVKGPYIQKPKPEKTSIYDVYWSFAAKRQEILFHRLNGDPAPWTDDPIIKDYRFTNAYRAADRVSQYLIKNIIYNKNWSPENLFFRILLFKIFNKIETWEALEQRIGELTIEKLLNQKIAKTLDTLRSEGRSIYSGAYIMASPSKYGYKLKHCNHLEMLKRMLSDKVYERIMSAGSLSDIYRLLISYPSIGYFLAFQYTIDLNYSTLTNFDESTFVVAGPGAKDGIHKCFSDTKGWSDHEIIRMMQDNQDHDFSRLHIDFKRLGDRPLKLIDCQNLFCEISKYTRISHPHLTGIGGRSKIKQRFVANPDPIALWFPPKWGINEYFDQFNQGGRAVEDLFS